MVFDLVYLPLALINWGIMLLAIAGFWFFGRKKKKKDAVWWNLRGGVVAFLFVMGWAVMLEETFNIIWVLGFILLALFIQIIVSSIIHLMKHKEKVLPITILVIVPLFIIWSIIYNLTPISNLEDDMCFEFCVDELGYNGFKWYWFDYNEYVCYCEDENENVLRQQSFI